MTRSTRLATGARVVAVRGAFRGCVFGVALVAGCAGPPAPTDVVGDAPPDAIYTDFLDGKFDGAGHPIGAFVLEGEACGAETGEAAEGGLDVAAGRDLAGVLCAGTSDPLGRGLHAVNVRAALVEACEVDCELPALEVVARDGEGAELATVAIAPAAFDAVGAFENHALELRVWTAGPVAVEVRYTGVHAVRLAYVEVFRRDRQLVIEPRSGVAAADAVFRAELIDPPEDATLALRCLDASGEAIDRTDALDALVAVGEGAVEVTDFRRIVTAPLAALVEGCASPTRLVAEMRRPDRVYATSEVLLLSAAFACPDDDGRPLVVVTGFLPFPAGSSSDNSSRQAVLGFDAAAVPDARVLPLVLPVEFDSAAALVLDVVERCGPAVVVGFGQGRWRVDVETTAYNAKDTSEVAGGVPDNRGLVLDGDPIREGGPAELSTRLPVDAIVASLADRGVDVATSDDPGRYVCNNLFYSLAHDAPPERIVGFVHLPIIRRVTDPDRAMLQSVVEGVVTEALAVSAP